MKKLIDNLKERGLLKETKLEQAFLKIDRKNFVPEKLKTKAYEDRPLPIGEGQTISQPSTVAFMLDLLNPQKGDKILDIGFGSGWTTGLLMEIVGQEGEVVGVERVPEIKKWGERNLISIFNKERLNLICGDGYLGYQKKSPYDKILVSAALSAEEEIPSSWYDQLVMGGVVVAPIGSYIYKLTKRADRFEKERYFGFRFVPLIKDEKDD